MQQNVTQLNLTSIPWNRINTTTISSIMSKHSTHTKSLHPHHPLFLYPKQVQETHEPTLFQCYYSQSNYHKQDFSTTTSKILCALIKPQHFKKATLGVYLQLTFTAPLQLQAYLESSGTSAVECFCRNNQRLKATGYFRKRTPSWIFDRIFNTALPINLVIACTRSEEKLSTNGNKQVNLRLTLPPDFLHYSNAKHKSKKTKSWTDPAFSISLSNTRNEKKK